MKNPKCDGGFCVLDEGEVKKYPVGDDANMILCVYCWGHENRFREDMSNEYPDEFVKWPQHNWFEAETYEAEPGPINKEDIIRKFAKEHGLQIVEHPLLAPPYPGSEPYGGQISSDNQLSLEDLIENINNQLGNTHKK